MPDDTPDPLLDKITESLFAEEFRLDKPTAAERARNLRDFQDMILGRPKMSAADPMDLPAAIAVLNERRHRGYSSWKRAELYLDQKARMEPIALVEDPGSLFPHAWWLTEFEAIAVAMRYEQCA